MLKETFELDLANSGLSGLDEVSFLRLFATTQAHALVQGTGHTLRDIVNADAVPLYPAFYRTRVSIPPPLLLSQYRVWDKVEVGADVQRFGRMLLESNGAIGAPGSLGDDPAAWGTGQHITIAGSMAFVHDKRTGDQQVDSPRDGSVAELAAMTKRPAALEEQRRIRTQGIIGPGPAMAPALSGRVRLPLLLTRDLQTDRALMFASFTSLLEVAEQTLLLEQIWPAFDPGLLSFRHLLEREVHYLGNVHQGDAVIIDTRAVLSPCQAPLASAYAHCLGLAVLELRAEVYREGTNAFLAAAHTKKIFVVPRTRGSEVQEIQRLLARHGGQQ